MGSNWALIHRSANIKFAFSEFTFDAETGVLTRKNRNLRIPEQTARLLAILLERANTLVTREELRRVLWPDAEFLDYDQGINTAINRLRSALRDDPRNPQYVKTIPKRGYVFHAEVLVLPFSSSAESALQRLAPEAFVVPTVIESPLPAFAEVEPAAAPFRAGLSTEVSRGSRLRAKRWMWAGGSLAIVIASLAYGIVHMRRVNTSPPAVALGVAPIQAQGGPQADEMAESFRLSLIDAIAQLPGVQVRAASAFANAKRADLNIPNLSVSLGLDDLLLGSVVAQGNAYDWKFELVRAVDAIHLASFEYSGTKEEFPSIRDRLQHDLFHYLQSRGSAVQAIKGSTNDAQAYEFYLQGTYHTFDRSQDSLNQAIVEYQAAFTRDPKFALAYAGMATACLKLSAYPDSSGKSLLRKAQEYARQAVRLDPMLAQPHAVLGYSAFSQDWDFVQGEKELRYAIWLDPTQSDYRDWLSVLLTYQGRFDEALQQIDLAHADDPRWPSVYAMEALMAADARRVSRSIAAGKKYVEMLPSLPMAHNTLAWAYFNTGQYKNAIAEWREMAFLQNDEARIQLEDRGLAALEKGGIRAYARLHLDAIQSHRATAQGNDFVPSEWYTCAGNRDQALWELERTVSSRDPYSLEIAVNPLYDSFHHDPRFLKLLATVGIPLPASLETIDSHVCPVGS